MRFDLCLVVAATAVSWQGVWALPIADNNNKFARDDATPQHPQSAHDIAIGNEFTKRGFTDNNAIDHAHAKRRLKALKWTNPLWKFVGWPTLGKRGSEQHPHMARAAIESAHDIAIGNEYTKRGLTTDNNAINHAHAKRRLKGLRFFNPYFKAIGLSPIGKRGLEQHPHMARAAVESAHDIAIGNEYTKRSFWNKMKWTNPLWESLGWGTLRKRGLEQHSHVARVAVESATDIANFGGNEYTKRSFWDNINFFKIMERLGAGKKRDLEDSLKSVRERGLGTKIKVFKGEYWDSVVKRFWEKARRRKGNTAADYFAGVNHVW